MHPREVLLGKTVALAALYVHKRTTSGRLYPCHGGLLCTGTPWVINSCGMVIGAITPAKTRVINNSNETKAFGEAGMASLAKNFKMSFYHKKYKRLGGRSVLNLSGLGFCTACFFK